MSLYWLKFLLFLYPIYQWINNLWILYSHTHVCVHTKLLQSCPTLCDPMDYISPGSSVHRILQEYWSGLPCPPPGNFSTQGSNLHLYVSWIGFPGGTHGKEPACQCRRWKRHRFNLWVGKIPWRRTWQPTPVFLPGESPGTEEPGGLQSTGLQSQTRLKRLNAHTRRRTHFIQAISHDYTKKTTVNQDSSSLWSNSTWMSSILRVHS